MKQYLILLGCIIILIFCFIYCKYKNNRDIEKFSNPSRKKIIAFSLWGNNECYNWGAVENALLAQELYPEWICRFYVFKDIIPEVKEKLESLNNVEVVVMDKNKGAGNMFWRFIPMFEEDCEAVLSRDTDSRLNQREKEAVDLWLKQDKDLLILRDHPNHNQLIMGGMFGVKNNVFHQFRKEFEKNQKNDKMGKYFDDQIFLRDIYHQLKDNKLVFDAHHHFKDEKILPYPQTDFKGYIGQIVCKDFTLTNKKYGLDIKNTKVNKPYAIPNDSEI